MNLEEIEAKIKEEHDRHIECNREANVHLKNMAELRNKRREHMAVKISGFPLEEIEWKYFQIKKTMHEMAVSFLIEPWPDIHRSGKEFHDMYCYVYDALNENIDFSRSLEIREYVYISYLEYLNN
jgi:hypothetical protein